MIFYPADIVLTARPGIVGTLIRRMEQSPGERRSIVEHCGVVSVGGNVSGAMLIESLARGTVERHLEVYAGLDVSAAIYRHTGLTMGQRRAIVEKARSYVGRKYGYLKLLAHAADYALGGRYVFRRLCRMDNYPICSWVVGHAYMSQEVYFRLNVPGIGCEEINPNGIQPDDIWDTVSAGDPWEVVGVI